ncbi:hypothetical protein NEPAR06_0152 [Nematocida parisii]|uniref:ERCC4 domain-containing protein n=1 Tax=Nematocida parisii (strain ERTm3) TaxID=935791 RepID=I3EDI9_NEMP3|nr:uncharacterized protein NEPG_00542 [Nematocida parisii ERTm1]EIJ87286.1 hypothetical protein NEQG_02621 [Nematocida parisii ERTm3]KAI5143117.1 hypothetical protein NEPAR07_0479 [Nematocida parisii]EIJ95017.1 hypothetical protein NEPG_00542 [Nematocida parisii ERTm1]KAI5153074.1 hypothetical protein NEPAR06_0152 [Nematocida parisii]KAI5158507.1 hypothetical protein NEPAR05_2041 [Nematocida parisii]|eukprot:XP_013058373.1 hypothetical protein NEPG_00542 [Nematocida parisii ERTm1]
MDNNFMNSKTEESGENTSSIIMDSSSKSLMDVSWLSSLQNDQSGQTEPAPDLPLYLPGWMNIETAGKSTDIIRMRVEGVYYGFLVSKYPETLCEVEEVEDRIIHSKKFGPSPIKEECVANCASIITDVISISDSDDPLSIPQDNYKNEKEQELEMARKRLNTRMFFLWDRESAEKNIALHNIHAIKHAKNGRVSIGLIQPADILEQLTCISLRHSVSFVYLNTNTLDIALNSLEAAILRDGKEAGPALKLKKTSNPQELMEIILRSISGIGNEEIRILKAQFASVSELSEINKIESITGVKESTILKIRSIFR